MRKTAIKKIKEAVGRTTTKRKLRAVKRLYNQTPRPQRRKFLEELTA